MPRPRSLSLSPLSRTSSSPSTSPPPRPTVSIQSLMTTTKLVRYSPYQASRASFSSVRTSSSGISEHEGTSGSDTGIYLGRRPSTCSTMHPDSASTPMITSRMSRLGLKSISPTPPRARPSHRRTQSLATPPSYGFIVLPQTESQPPSSPRRHSELSPRALNTFRTPSPPSAPIPTQIKADQLQVPLTPTRKASFDRMMLVNPAIAAHLRRGGAVNMRTPDGAKKWRIRLQRESGGLAGVMEEAEKSPAMVAVA